jgi:hypothetical protein
MNILIQFSQRKVRGRRENKKFDPETQKHKTGVPSSKSPPHRRALRTLQFRNEHRSFVRK